MEKEARYLIEKAHVQMKESDAEFERARRAQLDAEKAVEIANQLTSEALKKEIECKKFMVQAGKSPVRPFHRYLFRPKTHVSRS